MSIINQMLKDLDKRRNKISTEQEILAGINASQIAKFNQRKIWIISSTLLFFILIIFTYYSWMYPSKQQTTKPEIKMEITPISKDLKTHRPQNVITLLKQPMKQPIKQEQPVESVAISYLAPIPTLPKKIIPVKKAAPKTLAINENEENNIQKTIRPLTPKQRIEQEYHQAIELAESGNILQAISNLETIVKRFPNFQAAREDLIRLLIGQGLIDEASKILKFGLKLSPRFSPFIRMKAQLLMEQGQIKTALNLLSKDPPSIDEDPDYHSIIAAAYQQLEQPLLAANIYKQLLRVDSRNAVWWMGLGICLEQSGKANAAVTAYSRAESIGELNPELQAYVASRINVLRG